MATPSRLRAHPVELDITVVPMRRRHLRGVLRIEGQVYPRPWSLGLFLSELALRDSRSYVVARVGGAVVGYGGLIVTGTDGHVTTLAVDPSWQRRKIGTRLLLALVRRGIERGCTSLTLEVRMGNAGAQALYRRFGFVPAGLRKRYYAETNEDGLVMWTHDVDLPDYRARLERIDAALPRPTLVGGDG
ncbi:MAG: ribosomal protein S18-alanine N-acetyltransferase [Acidimicrobiales bacterium]